MTVKCNILKPIGAILCHRSRKQDDNKLGYRIPWWFWIALVLVLFSTSAFAVMLDIEDEDITTAIEADLLADEVISSHLIDVDTSEGIVTLSGAVATLLEKERAEKLSAGTKGVRSIVNLISVKPVLRSDSQIKEDVENALLTDVATDEYEVELKVVVGKVILTGQVDSLAEKMICEEVAKGVKGVIELENDIEISYKEKRPDSEIKKEVERVLKSNPYVNDETIDVDVTNGVVSLTGEVDSWHELKSAVENTFQGGAKNVITRLQVREDRRDETPTIYYHEMLWGR